MGDRLELDSQVKECVRQLRLAGGIVSTSIVMAAAKGIVQHRGLAILSGHGGPMKSWPSSLMTRMKMVKRKGTQAAQKVPRRKVHSYLVLPKLFERHPLNL